MEFKIVIRVSVVEPNMIYAAGIVHTLADHGITVVARHLRPPTDSTAPVHVGVVGTSASWSKPIEAYVRRNALTHPVLVLADDRFDGQVQPLLQAGASGLMMRSAQPNELVDAVRVLASGGSWSLLTDHGAEGAPGAGTVAQHGDESLMNIVLSPREEQVLGHISAGLTHTQVAKRLGISRHTVDTYVKRIRAKLGVGNKAELTRVAMTRLR